MDEQAREKFYKQVDEMEKRMTKAIPPGAPVQVVLVALGRMVARVGVSMETAGKAVESMGAGDAAGQ